MSIQSEIERISQAKTDIHSAIESKGVTVPDDTLISEMAPYIQQSVKLVLLLQVLVILDQTKVEMRSLKI